MTALQHDGVETVMKHSLV